MYNRNWKHFLSWTLLMALMAFFVMVPNRISAVEPTVGLGTTVDFAVLAGSAITNTGDTVVDGTAGDNIGVSPGTAVTGFPPGIVAGTIHSADATASTAQNDLTTAYNDAAGRSPTQDLSGQDLGGLVLTSGVYFFSSSAQLTGTLTLDAQGNPDAAFIFQIGSTLTTASASVVELVNGAQYCRVFWQVGSSATLGTDSEFIGHVFALTSITATTGAKVTGQLLARSGAVTLDNNTISNGVCAAPTPAATTSTPTTVAGEIGDTGEYSTPGSVLGIAGILLTGLAAAFWMYKRKNASRQE